MSLPTALARIDEIQQRIQTFWAQTTSTESTTGTGTTTATAFASAMADVLDTTSLTADGVTGEDVVAQAKTYLGVPYVFGGEDSSGMDCSGLVQRVLADLGIDAPRVVQDQADIGVEVGSLAEAQPGDLLVTNGEGHIVIYAGDGKIIHAPRPGKDVQLVDNYLSDADISTIRRVVPSAADTAATAATPLSTASTSAAASTSALASALSAAAALSASSTTGTSLFSSPAAAPAASPVTAVTTLAASLGLTLPAGAAAVTRATSAAPADTALTALSAAVADSSASSDAAALPAAFGALSTGVTDVAGATPAPAAASTAPAARPQLYTQVSTPVLNLAEAAEGEHTLTLRVTPENLGPVTVQARIAGGAMHVELLTPSDAGRDALRAILVDLRRDLAGLIANSSVTVSATADSSATGGQNPSSLAQSWSGGSGATASGQPGQPGQSGQSAPQGHGGHSGPAAIPGTPDQAAAPVSPSAPVSAGSGIDLYA